MKKIFYVAAAILAAGFVSCSDNDTDNTLQNPSEESATPILFNVGSGRVDIQQNAPATRGTGTVGDTIGTGNIWHGEALNVYMFKKDSLVLATENDGTTPIFENALVYAPDSRKDQTGVVYADYATVNGVKYYPMSGNYDFFAYRADDAAVGVPALNADTTRYILNVEIDGTQDLMIAKAAVSDTITLDSALRARCYSAYSARRGVQPHFKFEHLLSRLKFFATPNAEKDTIVRIESIKILGKDHVKSNGDTVKAACTNAEFSIAWLGNRPAALLDSLKNPNNVDIALMQVDTAAINAGNDSINVDLVALTPFAPVWDKTAGTNGKGVKTQVGESMLLFPAESYVMEITLSQNVAKEGEPADIRTNKLYNELKLPVDAQGAPVSFKAGNQYHINFVVYGLEEIKLELELTPWNYVEGANDVEINDDVEF